MGRFMVRFGTFQGGSNIVMITGQRVLGLNLPPALAAWLNQPSAPNAIENLDMGPDGHFALTYRINNGTEYRQLRSPGLEAWLGIPPLPLSTLISFAWGQSDARGTIGAVISTRLDERVGQLIWTYRNIPQSMTDWMAQNNVQFNANIQEYDLGCNDSWMLLMGTGGAYDMDDYVEAQLKSHGNVIHSGFSFDKMAAANCYLELPLPHLHISTAWLPTLSPAINDKPLSALAKGYYDEYSRSIKLVGTAAILPNYGGAMQLYGQGKITAANYGQGGYQGEVVGGGGNMWNAENVGTGLDIVNNGLQLANTVVPLAASAGASCCVIL